VAAVAPGDEAPEQVANGTALGTPANLRTQLAREIATTPTAYRRAFRGDSRPNVPGTAGA
jgi:hypothetical protein